MGGKTVVGSSTKVKKVVETKPDGANVTTTTTTTVDKYSDGSEETRTQVETKTEKGEPQAGSSSAGAPKSALAATSAPNPKEARVFIGEQENKKFMEEALKTHNELRAKHSSPPLTLNSKLSAIAQAWANKIAAKQKMEHSTTDFGENIFFSSKTITDGAKPVQSWYSEIKDFNFNKMEPQSGTGHFTQLIWKDTNTLGIALAYDKNGATYVVANYDPAGNFVGLFDKNIFRAN